MEAAEAAIAGPTPATRWAVVAPVAAGVARLIQHVL
jgi:hypothetical protein